MSTVQVVLCLTVNKSKKQQLHGNLIPRSRFCFQKKKTSLKILSFVLSLILIFDFSVTLETPLIWSSNDFAL